MTHTPLIGFSLDYETKQTYSKLPWYAIRENYFTAVAAHGATPIGLPYVMEQIERYLDLIDGLVIIGGHFDVPPEMYGQATTSDTVILKQNRTAFEFAITRGAIDRKIPILGICGGQQLLNVVLGGSLVQHIPDTYDSDIAHEQPNPRHEPGHRVAITEGTLLHRIAGKTSLEVNSAHHQAVAEIPEGVIVNAIAPDGVIEGIEYPAHPFCLGVQWHPEYHVSPADRAIFKAFIEACKAHG